MIRYLLILLFCTPTYAATYKLVERNGDVVTERAVISVTIPRDGVIVVVPDRIFHDTESAASPPKRSIRPPPSPNLPSGGNAKDALSAYRPISDWVW